MGMMLDRICYTINLIDYYINNACIYLSLLLLLLIIFLHFYNTITITITVTIAVTITILLIFERAATTNGRHSKFSRIVIIV